MKLKGLVVLLLLIVFIGAVLHGQEVNKSDKKVMIEGKPYYIHIVKKGETIYAISKAYGVMQKDIAMENPSVFDGLHKGQSLKIPIITQPKQKKDSDKYYYHTVEQGETIYYLTKKYNVKEKDIYKLNPKAKKGIQIGQELKILKPKNNKEAFKTEDENYFYHKVAKKETLYSISKKYKVEQQIIINNNPEISVAGLKYDMIIKIPKKNTIELVAIKDTILTDTLANNTIISDSLIVECNKINYLQNPVKFKVALLLPFIKDGITLSKEIDLREIKEIRPKPFLEFYEGFLLAIKDLQAKGLELELFVYDTKKDTAEILAILKKAEMQEVDLIIGPIYSNLFPIVAKFAKEKKIKIVSPLSANKNFVETNPYVFQIVPSFNAQLNQAIDFLGYSKLTNFIIVHNDTKEELDFIAEKKQELKNSFIKNNTKASIKVFSFKQKGVKGLIPLILKDTGNVIIIPSSNQAFVSDVVTRIFIQFHKDFDLSIIGFPVWTKFDNISLEYLHNLKLHTFTHNYVDYKNANVKQFVSNFRKLYLCEPQQYGFLGYDIANYFLNALVQYGTNFALCLDSVKAELLQTKFKFIKHNKNSGFENTGTFIIKYDEEYNVNSINIEDLYIKQDTTIIQNY